MHMLVRVEMVRLSADQETKRGELPRYLALYRPGVIQWNLLVQGYPFTIPVCPFTEVYVQAEAQFWLPASVGSSLFCSYAVDHQAGARHDAILEGLDDATVHASAEPEIIGVDNQVTPGFSFHRLKPQVI